MSPDKIETITEHHFDFLKYLCSKGGPDAEDFYDLDAWIAEIADKTGNIDREALIDILGDAFSTATMQGFAFLKPHGYAGDYEIIDRIYQRYVAPQPHLSKWDVYWQNHAAAEAVRNRVDYFCEQVSAAARKADGGTPVQVLNLASGPGRDMLHFFQHANEMTDIFFDCIEQDSDAIAYAKSLCIDFSERIHFIQKNALRFETEKRYDLIWSAGLFDYFDDKVFVFLLARLKRFLLPGGQVVVGNFSTTNPSRPYMELFQWHLNHRSPQTLRSLAIRAGFDPARIRIGKESAGVNLFLHAVG